MWKTILFLVVTILIIPFLAYKFDTPLTELQVDALKSVGTIYLVAAGLCFLISSFTKNYSQVDKLWSLLPIVYCWVIAHMGGYEPRLVLMSVLVSVWGLRLSYNFARRGGYTWKFWEGEEDYRWAELKKKPEFKNPIVWTLFNLFFISLYQLGLILLFTLPILKCMEGGPLGWIDYILALLIIVLIIIETIADQEQWVYQNEKHRLIRAGKELSAFYKKGFVHTGLWGKVRHPNYAAEQAIWVVFYFFSVVATGSLVNWTAAGFLLLIALFKGSSDFSEEISAGKYPEYEDYQKNVSRFFPF